MRFAAFEELAWREWESIPEHFRGGVDSLRVERDARAHADRPDVYTLGECLTETYPSEVGGPETTRSTVVLYYGSFRRLAALDPEFDWEAEVWETLTHELQHHLESVAVDEGLLDVDAAMEEHFARRDGEPFDPFYYRSGEAMGRGTYRLDGLYFIEIEGEGEADRTIRFVWDEVTYRIPAPAVEGDVVFAEVVGGVAPAPAELYLVLLFPRDRPRGLRALFRRGGPRVAECEVTAERVPAAE
jgi:hypothetical protein